MDENEIDLKEAIMDYIYIGKIIATRGLIGEVKVLSSTDYKEERYAKDRPVYVKMGDEYIPLFVLKYRVHKGLDLLTFVGLNDINLVEKYVKCELYSEDTLIESKTDDEFHLEELLDVKIYQYDELKGVVENVREYPQGDYLVVRLSDQSTKLVPFRDEFIKEVDIENKRIDIEEIEGLL